MTTITVLQLFIGAMAGSAFMGVLVLVAEHRRMRRAKRLGPARPEQLHDLAARLRGLAGTLDGLAYDESEAASVGTVVPGPSGSAAPGARATA